MEIGCILCGCQWRMQHKLHNNAAVVYRSIVHEDHEDLLHHGNINASMLLNTASRKHAKDVFPNMHIGYINTSKMHIFVDVYKNKNGKMILGWKAPSLLPTEI